MSKKTKARAKTKRASEKRARKASLKAKYQAWAADGITKGSKRQRNKRGRGAKLVNPHRRGSHIPWNVDLFCNKRGELLPGAPHAVYIAWKARQEAA